MQSWYIGISNFISEVWNIIQSAFQYFFGLFDTLGEYLTFVRDMLNYLPSIVKVPASIILTIMVIKFVMNLGKN